MNILHFNISNLYSITGKTLLAIIAAADCNCNRLALQKFEQMTRIVVLTWLLVNVLIKFYKPSMNNHYADMSNLIYNILFMYKNNSFACLQ